MSYSGLGQDRTAQDWAAGIRTGGELISSIIGAASGGSRTPTTTMPAPMYTPTTDVYYPTTQNTSDGSWTIPLLIGGTLIVGIGAYLLISRRSVKANRRRVRANRRRR